MPPRIKVCKEDILQAAVEIVRNQGVDALNARAVAGALGCSTQPVFSNYAGMDELKADVINFAGETYRQFVTREISTGAYPAYKSSGMAYIRFAKEETELFRLLYMRRRTEEEVQTGEEQLQDIVGLIQKNTGLSQELAILFHAEMWAFVHGIATMFATSYLNWDFDLISSMLTDVYKGLCKRFRDKG